MDPLGFAFENYDAVGKWRDKDGSYTIDPSGELPDGKRFAGPGELVAILKSKKELFARCLTEKGVKMYGAYWCPHCAEQKQLFDASFEYAPYIECGVQGNTAKLQQVCIDAGIKHFPTWQFPPVGERVEGTMPLADLSFRTGCPLQ